MPGPRHLTAYAAGRLCLGESRNLHTTVAALQSAAHAVPVAHGGVAGFVRSHQSGRRRRGCCSCACYSGVRANTGGRPLRPGALECCIAGRTGSLGCVGQRGCWRSEAEFCWVLDTNTPSLRGSESLESSPAVSPPLSIQNRIGIRSSVRGWPRRPVHGGESLAVGRISRVRLEQTRTHVLPRLVRRNRRA